MIESPHSPALVGASSAAQTVRFVCIHGHFYQPPRENPWLEAIEGQPSAYPYHDWNERITAECYAPNANARILDAENRIIAIVNNYASMSFNFGPTLLSWLEEKDPEVYRAILAADAESARRFSGHGSAMAQPYNHMILPLAGARDRATQVAWGIADFRRRFGREPEGMWLPETAVDLDTLEDLAAAGIRFTILSPQQASHVRRVGEEQWREAPEGGPDPTVPYRVVLPSGASIAVFFYDGPISRAVAFDRLLSRGDHLAERLMGAFSADREGPQLVHIATDGETFGHHHRHGDMALAYALQTIETAGLARVTNYGEFLERFPPVQEARIREKTSWSCAHGVERWRSDCGCQSGAHPGWNQAWRAPLRGALDALRAALAPAWEERAGGLLVDPWKARDAYVGVILDRSPENARRFLREHARRELSEAERIETWKLLELQRHAQLMYTSCGWFFDDIGGIEARQILAYAGRALELARDTLGSDFEPLVLEPLSRAASNVPETGDGRRIYETSVRPAAVSLQDVGAHYGVHALFADYESVSRVYCYRVAREELRELTSGRARLQLGRARVSSEITGESARAAWGVLHLGDHNLSGGLLRSEEPDAFEKAEEELSALFRRADLPEILRAVDRSFGSGDRYALRLLFRDEQQQVLGEILRSVLDEADDVYRRLYEEHAPLMRFLSSHGVAPPRGFRMAAEQALNTRLRRELEDPEPDVARLEAVLEEARNVGVTLHEDGLGRAFERTIDRLATELRARPGDRERLADLERIVALAKHLPFEVDFWKVQNAYYQMAKSVLPARRREAEAGFEDAREWVERFLALGAGLAVKVEDPASNLASRV
jgi:alpha-amylase/alpha-mannosidase (GH57 family)